MPVGPPRRPRAPRRQPDAPAAQVSGEAVYSKLKYESGVQRVQRVPQTETQGRVHTSTATARPPTPLAPRPPPLWPRAHRCGRGVPGPRRSPQGTAVLLRRIFSHAARQKMCKMRQMCQ